MPKRSQLPRTREYQVLKTVVEDAISGVIPTWGMGGKSKYGEAVVGIGTQYSYKSPQALRGVNNIRIRIQEAYAEINREISELIIKEYRMLIKHAGAVARGENDPKSLMNALDIVQDPKRPFDFHIEVVNRVWLYQEYGFDMKGRMPPISVAKRILQWAIDKGIVGILRSRQSVQRDNQGRKKYKYALKQRTSKYYERVDSEIVEDEDLEDDGNLTRFMWYITKLVVDGNTGKDNGRLFLTTAFHNITADKALIKQLERKWLREYRVISK